VFFRSKTSKKRRFFGVVIVGKWAKSGFLQNEMSFFFHLFGGWKNSRLLGGIQSGNEMSARCKRKSGAKYSNSVSCTAFV